MEKTIYLIRHGQSTFNQVYNNIEDPYLFDARLTEFGENQANQLSEQVEKHFDKVELIITSPLTRALETTKRSLGKLIENKNIPCIVHSLHRELLTTSDDNGRNKSIIEKEYPQFNFSLINEERWWIPEFCEDSLKFDLSIDTNEYFKKKPFRESNSLFKQRLIEFKQYLLSRPESNIVVVGHGDFFYFLLGEKMEDIENCKIIKWLINKNESKYL